MKRIRLNPPSETALIMLAITGFIVVPLFALWLGGPYPDPHIENRVMFDQAALSEFETALRFVAPDPDQRQVMAAYGRGFLSTAIPVNVHGFVVDSMARRVSYLLYGACGTPAADISRYAHSISGSDTASNACPSGGDFVWRDAASN